MISCQLLVNKWLQSLTGVGQWIWSLGGENWFHSQHHKNAFFDRCCLVGKISQMVTRKYETEELWYPREFEIIELNFYNSKSKWFRKSRLYLKISLTHSRSKKKEYLFFTHCNSYFHSVMVNETNRLESSTSYKGCEQICVASFWTNCDRPHCIVLRLSANVATGKLFLCTSISLCLCRVKDNEQKM